MFVFVCMLHAANFGLFSSYGWDTLEYYSYSRRDRLNMLDGIRNPMCSLFPTEVSCSVPVVGAAGDDQSYNGICVLSQVRTLSSK